MGFVHTDEYLDALRKENFRRVSIYTERDWKYTILPGLVLKPITLRMYAVLQLNRSPFLYSFKSDEDRRYVISVADVLFFLWVISEDFGKVTQFKFQNKALKILQDIDSDKVKDLCWDYYCESTYDWTGVYLKSSSKDINKSYGNKEPYSSDVSDAIHTIAQAYHWTRDEILDLALIEFGQYFRNILRQECSELLFLNYNKDKAAREYMRNKNRAVREAKESGIEESAEASQASE